MLIDLIAFSSAYTNSYLASYSILSVYKLIMTSGLSLYNKHRLHIDYFIPCLLIWCP